MKYLAVGTSHLEMVTVTKQFGNDNKETIVKEIKKMLDDGDYLDDILVIKDSSIVHHWRF